ncbi:MAG: DUF2484 family protein [Rhodobacteraceae bacterium]|nr:DUF2484 family protein [Paracoccaceae bacterium]MCF8514783.1 DUF2484 family protein [Paracoccaceae bacterium]MCF8519027.1 DUF2484 family protein [Paracoccaceae bacterium]
MSYPLIAALMWLVIANVIAMFPSRDHHWRTAYALITIGIPLLGWVTSVEGPLWGLILLAGGASVLRWPLIHLWRRIRPQPKEPAE